MEGIEKTEFLVNYEFITVSDVVKQAVAQEALPVLENAPTPSGSTPLASGFHDLDQIIQSFNPHQLVTIAVRPGKGKTAFLLSLIHNISITNHKRVAIFSPERSAIKLVQRLIESETCNSAERVYSGTVKEADKPKVDRIIQQFIQSNVYIDDSTSLSIQEIHDRCKFLIDTHKVDLILFDNLELYSKNILDSTINFSEQEKIMYNIHQLAESIDTPIIVLSHTTNMNNLHDINDSPTIGNVAPYICDNSEVVIFVHRPNTLNINRPEYADWKGFAELIVAKHPTVQTPVSVKLKFIESSDRFTDI
jgi:replicative DNA helicase